MAAAGAAAGDRQRADLAAGVAMALLTPGCFAAARARFAVELLAAEGYTPVYAQLVSFDREKVERVWSGSLARLEPDRQLVVYDLLLSAESLLMVLAGRGRPAGAGAMEWLAGRKGHSDPARCRPGSLRTRLGAANRVINMLHTPETTGDMIRELAVLLAGDDLATAWRAAAVGHAVRLGGPFLDIGRRWCGNSVAHVAAAARFRLAEALAAEAGPLDGWPERCRAEWDWVSRQATADPSAVIAGYRETFTARPPVPPPAGLSGTGRARLAALHMLDDLMQGKRVGVPEMRDLLARARCAVGRWEWVVLASSAVSARAPSPHVRRGHT